MTQKYFKKLCILDITKNISKPEKDLLNSFLEKSPHNKLEYKKIEEIWEKTSPINLDLKTNIDDEWNTLNELISDETTKIKTNKSSISNFIRSFFTPKLRPAFGFGLIVIALISSILVYNDLETKKILKSVQTVNNERIEITLSDGSIVHLNSGSQIQYLENFEDEKREIKLKGEAFFSVKKDGRPFIISTDNATTTVLGTQFNVWSRDSETRVIVKEGKVSLAEKTRLNNKVILTKGETSRVSKTLPPSNPIKVNPENLIGWIDGKIVFDNTPFNEISAELERFYDISITLEETELKNYNLTGTFDNEAVDSVLAKICLALNLKYVQNGNIYKVMK